MFDRLRRLIKLSKKDPKVLDRIFEDPKAIEAIPEAGDGKAEFLGSGTEKEFKDMENEDKGLKGIFGL